VIAVELAPTEPGGDTQVGETNARTSSSNAVVLR